MIRHVASHFDPHLNLQLLQEKEREKRSVNLIIHGLEEKGNDANEINNNDEAMEMVNNTDRDAVMKNHKLLKGTEEELGKLSVREDYTKNEREQIKKLVDIAKDKNAEDCSYHWVVRGSPRNGLHLVKLTRR